jgi:putative tryptophan/tyrosine transport system substrate-binding protein
MRRREFITLLGGAVAFGRYPAHAQQPPVPVIAFLRGGALAGSEYIVNGFREGLKEAGYIDRQNVVVEYHSVDDQDRQLPGLIAEFTRRKVALIVGNTPSAHAAKATGTTIPIVFASGSDPVADGLVPSINRPGGHITGVVFFNAVLAAKRVGLLRQVAPGAATIAMLVHPSQANTEADRREAQAAAQSIGKRLVTFEVGTERDIESAFSAFAGQGAGALLVGAGGFLNSNREKVVALAARHALPAIYAQREAVLAGGLMSYGASIPGSYRQAGVYAGRILKGEKPGDLPVVQSSTFEFAINLKTAKALGLAPDPQLLATADEVVE